MIADLDRALGLLNIWCVARRLLPALLALLALAGVFTACGDDDSSAGAATTTTAPEEARASDAEVAAGLATIKTLTADISAAVTAKDADKASELVEQIEPAWAKIEGTIKENDEDTYLAFEDAFAAIGVAVKDGDAAKTAETANAIAKTADDYVRAHPA